MSEIMSYDRWMKYTYGGRTSIRSSQLKAIDAALNRYQTSKSPADLDALRKAIVAWMQKEGPGWKSSQRNKFHAVDDLYREAMGIPAPSRTGAEVYGFSLVRAESRTIVDDIFRGKSLTWKPGFLAVKLANNKWGARGNTASVAADSVEVAGKAGQAMKMAQDIFHSIVPSGSSGEVSSLLAREMPSFMNEFAASMVPFAGVIVTGGSAVYSGIKTAYDQYCVSWGRMHVARTLSTDEPAAAFNALVRILERERNADAFSASVSGTAFVGKLAGVLADGGTATNAAIGLAASAAKLMNIVRVIVRDVLEKNEANRRMQRGGVNGEIFDVCPIVGAYLILCVPTSVMVNTVFDRVGEHGWRGDVERAVKRHIVPLQNEARRMIDAGRFEIVGLKNYPGLVARNDKKLKEMAERKGKTGMVGFGPSAWPLELG